MRGKEIALNLRKNRRVNQSAKQKILLRQSKTESLLRQPGVRRGNKSGARAQLCCL